MTTVHHVTCPFCSLLCDDLSVERVDQSLSASTAGCSIAAAGFAKPAMLNQASINNTLVEQKQALQYSARLLKKSRKPLIAGLGTDVNGIRAALHLAEKTGAVIKHKYENKALCNLKTMQNSGWVMTTLAEVKNRADVVVFIGDKVTATTPRFIERFIQSSHAQFLKGKKIKNTLYLGNISQHENTLLGKHNVNLKSKGDKLASDFALLKSKLSAHPLYKQKISSGKNHLYEQAAKLISAAEYPVFIWSTSALPENSAELIIHSVNDLIRQLNQSKRAAGLSLSDANAGSTVQSVMTWQTGYPAGVSFEQGSPASSPRADKDYPDDIDALVWISSLETDSPPDLGVPTIILSNNPAMAKQANVHLPIGTPGLDHSGNLFRTDSVVNLPLKKLRDSGLSRAADVINQLVELI